MRQFKKDSWKHHSGRFLCFILDLRWLKWFKYSPLRLKEILLSALTYFYRTFYWNMEYIPTHAHGCTDKRVFLTSYNHYQHSNWEQSHTRTSGVWIIPPSLFLYFFFFSLNWEKIIDSHLHGMIQWSNSYKYIPSP